MTRLEQSVSRPSWTTATFLFCLFLAHLAAAVVWLWFMPGGFPVMHTRFWANRVLPACAIVAAVGGLVALCRGRWTAVSYLLIALAATWTAAGVVGLVLFPRSRASFFLAAIVASVLIWLNARRVANVARTVNRSRGVLVGLCACLLGSTIPFSQRAGEGDTRPLDIPPPRTGLSPDGGQLPTYFRTVPGVEVFTTEPTLKIRAGLTIRIEPMLTFISRSPDRFWTSLAPDDERDGPRRKLLSARNDASEIVLAYKCDGPEILSIRTLSNEPLAIRAIACCELPQPVYSHLNSFTTLYVSGHRRLSLSFSPCEQTRIEVTPSDYPIGRPRRLAFVGRDDVFHVVEASSGEKGPFHELARGALADDSPLTITFHDEEKPVARITFHDWARQSGRQLSPTAGWGLPVNAIEFSRDGEAPDSPVAIWITLAGTSVGRGWDSVGHKQGIYRNQMTIESLSDH